MKIKAYIGRLKKKGTSNTSVLIALRKISPFTMWQGICIADYLDKKYPEMRLRSTIKR